MNELAGQVVVITGGTSGIGLACARRCGREGATVVITGRGVDSGREAETRLLGEGIAATFVAADVTRDADWQQLMKLVAQRWGRLDALVNNAGTCTLQPFAALPPKVAEGMIATNFRGAALGLRHAISPLRASGGGTVIAISTVAALRPAFGNGAYAGSKAALLGLHQALAADLARGPAPIRLNVVFPGLIWGENIVENFGEDGARAFRESIMASTPLNRVGRPEDIADWVYWLVAPAGRSAWGNELVIDGGLAFGGPRG